MHPKINHFTVILLLTVASSLIPTSHVSAQLENGVYFSEQDGQQYELKIRDNYLVISVFETSPAKFVKTFGGYYSIEDEKLNLALEFNSNFEKDHVKNISYPIQNSTSEIILGRDEPQIFKKATSLEQALDGNWLFATRGPDTGQDRRGDENPRKTLKFLVDGRFQWIAYNTETFKFHGSGGGSFTSRDGNYTENIEYFSRDDARVGATLNFKYEVKNQDWHHTGNNSKGEPMYEIWTRREK